MAYHHHHATPLHFSLVEYQPLLTFVWPYRDARIAALEQGSAETEKILAEARTERLQHMDEVYQANRKSAQLEAK